MNNDDINDYIPSILNPRGVRKQNGDISFTQKSSVSRCSLSLRRNSGLRSKPSSKVHSLNKENSPNIQNLTNSTVRAKRQPTCKKDIDQDSLGLSAIDDLETVVPNQDNFRVNDIGQDETSSSGFSDAGFEKKVNSNKDTTVNHNSHDRRSIPTLDNTNKAGLGETNKDNVNDTLVSSKTKVDRNVSSRRRSKVISDVKDKSPTSVAFNNTNDAILVENREYDEAQRLVSVSSHTELDQNVESSSDTTIVYNRHELPSVSVSFGVSDCKTIDVTTNKSSIKKVSFTKNDNNTVVDCELIESLGYSTESDLDVNMNGLLSPNSKKRSAVSVNLEIKKKKPSPTETAENKVLILNTNAIEKISHVIVQPPNYKLVKGKLLDNSKFKKGSKRKSVCNVNNGNVCVGLRQKSIETYFSKRTNVILNKVSKKKSLTGSVCDERARSENNVEEEEMSRNLGVAESNQSDRGRKSPFKGLRIDNESPNRSSRGLSPRVKEGSPRPEIKITCSSPRGKADNTICHSPRKNVESMHFSLATKSSTKRSVSARTVPHHKIVAGTHFAVDAFSYGDIPNVRHYFLTHFHSDHYAGLKKSFNKLLFCSKITADLCISRIGVNPKCIHVIKVDETIRIDDVEVTTVEANHCPGAVMLVFTLPNGKSLLHTGDFRASPTMESYPIFWNKDIHTIYLDTTYCNPRYDFPTQEQSLEMALYILRQKKVALEKVGKKFSSVLIVCGTYTIGKEKFFLGMSRRVGCSVWACPEKDRVLQAVEGRSFGHTAPHACQLHVVPMRDLTHEKLRTYLDSLKGAFNEIVAFKPSGWENGKTSSVEKDMVTIHGIPYSEHSSFSELIRFVKFLKPKQVVPTVDISGGVRAVQKYFPCPLVHKEEIQCQSKVTDFFSIQTSHQVAAVT